MRSRIDKKNTNGNKEKIEKKNEAGNLFRDKEPALSQSGKKDKEPNEEENEDDSTSDLLERIRTKDACTITEREHKLIDPWLELYYVILFLGKEKAAKGAEEESRILKEIIDEWSDEEDPYKGLFTDDKEVIAVLKKLEKLLEENSPNKEKGKSLFKIVEKRAGRKNDWLFLSAGIYLLKLLVEKVETGKLNGKVVVEIIDRWAQHSSTT